MTRPRPPFFTMKLPKKAPLLGWLQPLASSKEIELTFHKQKYKEEGGRVKAPWPAAGRGP